MMTRIVGQIQIRVPPDSSRKSRLSLLWYSGQGQGAWNHQTDRAKLRDCVTRWLVIFPRVKVMNVVEKPEELFQSEEDQSRDK